MAKHGVFAQNRVTIDQKLDKKDKQVAELKRTPPPCRKLLQQSVRRHH